MTGNDMLFRKDITKFRSGLCVPFSGKKDTLKKAAVICSKPLVPMCQNTRHRIEEGSNLHYYCYANVESHYTCICARFRRNTHDLLFTAVVCFIVRNGPVLNVEG